MRHLVVAATMAACGACKATEDPFPEPIPATEGTIQVNYVELASIPDREGTAARMMTLLTEPGTRRIFVTGGQLPSTWTSATTAGAST